MDDGIAHLRSIASVFQDALARFGSGARRWGEAADAGRAMWDDGAGREVFQRFLDPHRALLATGQSEVAGALEGQQAALTSASSAAAEAQRAAAEVAQAESAVARARSQVATMRGEINAGRGEVARTRSMVQAVTNRVTGLGA